MKHTLLRHAAVTSGLAVAAAGSLFALTGTALADQQVPPGTLGTVTATTPTTGVAATAPTVTSSGPCDGKDADGTDNPDQNTIAVILFSPSLNAAGKQKTGQTVQASTANYSRTSRMSVPFGQTFTDAFKQAGATIAPNERVRIEMRCIDALATPGGTFEGSVLFNSDASRYTFDAPAATTPPPAPLPEVPLAALLPIAGLGAAGILVARRRREGAR